MKAANILETLGRTPLVEISKKLNGTAAKVFAKVESFNPGGSAKDRVAAEMVAAAERDGKLSAGGTMDSTVNTIATQKACICGVYYCIDFHIYDIAFYYGEIGHFYTVPFLIRCRLCLLCPR